MAKPRRILNWKLIDCYIAAGYKAVDIAKEFGVDRCTITDWFKAEHGITYQKYKTSLINKLKKQFNIK